MTERVKTGISGFDQLVEGGLPKGSAILFSGSPGTGKTLFGLEFIYKGAIAGEKGLYVTFEETENDILNQAEQFSWDFKELKKKNMAEILAIPARKITPETGNEIIEKCKKEGIKRLVIDSLSTLSVNAPIYTSTKNIAVKDVMADNVVFSPPIIGDFVVKRFIYNFIDDLKQLPETTKILISEISQDGETMSRDTLSEFLCDGVIIVTFESLGGEYSRSLLIRKMRQTKNDEDIHPLEISKKGLIVHTLEE